MSHWQRPTRLLIAVAAGAFAIAMALAFKGRAPAPIMPPLAGTDPKAVLESAAGHTYRVKGEHEDVSIRYDKLLTYADGSTKMIGVTVVTEQRDGPRSFTITGKEGLVAANESNISLTGDVRLAASDGLIVRTEQATYAESDGMVRVAGPVEFSSGRLNGSGHGLTYEKSRDVLIILERAVMHIEPDDKGAKGAEISAGSAEMARREKIIHLGRTMRARRAAQTVEADAGVAHLSEDEKRLETMELRGNSRITGSKAGTGGLRALTGRDIDLRYAPDGEAIEHAVIVGEAVIQLAGEGGKAGGQIAARALDLSLAPDGSTPTSLTGRAAVRLTFPLEPGVPARAISADAVDGAGEPGRGLTRARFGGNVRFRERGPGVDRAARSGTLDVTLKPGMSSIDEATFAHAVRFEEGTMAATAASARYVLDQGTLELTGTEPGLALPHVANEQIAVDAARIEVTLEGPKVKASGGLVKSVLQPPKQNAETAESGKAPDRKMSSMLKQDQPVNVTANDLFYDGSASTATYTENAQLWQADMSLKAKAIVVDNTSGDLTAAGSVATATLLDQEGENKKRERVRSMATSKDFKYEESLRRATYVGDAHMSGPQGDMTAAKIELYLKPSGDELERAEAYEGVTLRERNRKTTGNRMTYFGADERYVVTGTPVTIVDECGSETTGKTVTLYKATDRVVVDGNEQIRTRTKGSSKCP